MRNVCTRGKPLNTLTKQTENLRLRYNKLWIEIKSKSMGTFHGKKERNDPDWCGIGIVSLELTNFDKANDYQ